MKITMLGGEDAERITQGRPVAPKKAREVETADRMVANAHDAKVSATDRWVRGEMSSKEHGEVHKKADKVISRKGRM